MGWSEVLDDMERRVAEARRGLRAGDTTATPFTLPADLGPLPSELQTRAARVLRETESVRSDVELARDRIVDALRLGRLTAREPAAYVDTRA